VNLEQLKKDSKYHWTNHVVRKMLFYGLSPDRVKRVIRMPKRVEEGIAENTIGVMQPSTNIKKPTEVWVMYQDKSKVITRKRSERSNRRMTESQKLKAGNKIVVISAWRYPGISPIGKKITIPQDILEELREEGILTNS